MADCDHSEPGWPEVRHDNVLDGLEYREMRERDLAQLRDIDRSERVTVSYRVVEGELRATPVDWDVPTFRDDEVGSHTVAEQIRFCERHLSAGARAMGAFDDGGRLVGVGLVTPAIRPGMAQLAYLHVSRRYRRRGVATRLARMLIEFALESGARQVYVSATPSESAVQFYRSLGFRLSSPLPELYELEPEDIHMIADLPHNRPKPATVA